VLEVGAKWQLFDGDLALRTALYRADKTWERNTDLESTAAILTKKRRTDGIEFEAAGRLGSQWEIFAGVALMDAKILEVAENRNAATGALILSDPKLVGQVARNTPNYTFNLWTTYKIDSRWKVAAGVESKGRRFVYQPQTTNAGALFTSSGEFNPNTAPAYSRIDAMLSFDPNRNWQLRLNVQNLFDKVYYDALYDNGGFGVPGTRRRVIGTVTYKFL
jgi:catecholate siderophore receptor